MAFRSARFVMCSPESAGFPQIQQVAIFVVHARGSYLVATASKPTRKSGATLWRKSLKNKMARPKRFELLTF